MGVAEYMRTEKVNTGATRTAFITDACTGCGGAPVCITFCRNDALLLVQDIDNYPFRKMRVNSLLCKGCGSCISNGQDGVRLAGCPWDAIQMRRIYADKGGI